MMKIDKHEAFDFIRSIGIIIVIILLAYIIYTLDNHTTDLVSTWGESAEFSQLWTGQDRFSQHQTNIEGLYITVDHYSGVQYLCNDNGIVQLVDKNGNPILVLEAAN